MLGSVECEGGQEVEAELCSRHSCGVVAYKHEMLSIVTLEVARAQYLFTKCRYLSSVAW